LDYWGTSFRGVARYLDEYASANATGRLRVFVCGSRRLLEPFLDPSKFEFLTRKEFDRGDVVPDLIVAQNLASIQSMSSSTTRSRGCSPWSARAPSSRGGARRDRQGRR
jgi:hypothetical protein